MRDFFRHLRAAWLFGRHIPFCREADTAEFWSTDDSMVLQAFLLSDVGKKLRARLFNHVTQLAFHATSPSPDATHRSGVAFGARAILSDLDSHIFREPLPEQSGETETDSAGALSQLAQLAP